MNTKLIGTVLLQIDSTGVSLALCLRMWDTARGFPEFLLFRLCSSCEELRKSASVQFLGWFNRLVYGWVWFVLN